MSVARNVTSLSTDAPDGVDVTDAAPQQEGEYGEHSSAEMSRHYALSILGTRGVPAHHGGFETFAAVLSRYLASRGWQVSVYCQDEGDGPVEYSDWHGVRRVIVPIRRRGSLGTILFDWKSTRLAAHEKALVLTLGYNTGAFASLYRLRGRVNLFNMDGLEWTRQKWRWYEKLFLYVNERLACWLGNHLIADHPEIKRHLGTRVQSDKITMIPYGANEIVAADAALLAPYNIEPNGYALVVARPEPENLVLQTVRAFSRCRRGLKLVVLGGYDPRHSAYHRRVMAAASDEVIFPGGIYDVETVAALRFHSRLYIHGHTAGGTNPSLVESLGAGSAILAHDNRFNRWVAGDAARYFADENACAKCLDELLDDHEQRQQMREAARERFREAFTWDSVLADYERLLTRWAARQASKTIAPPRPHRVTSTAMVDSAARVSNATAP